MDFENFTGESPLLTCNRIIKLAFAKPETITPQTGKAWERFVAAGHKFYPDDDQVQFVLDFFLFLKNMDKQDFCRLWLGMRLHPYFADADTWKIVRLIYGVADGALIRAANVSAFCITNNVKEDIQLVFKKVGVILEFMSWLAQVRTLDPHFLEARTQEWVTDKEILSQGEWL